MMSPAAKSNVADAEGTGMDLDDSCNSFDQSLADTTAHKSEEEPTMSSGNDTTNAAKELRDTVIQDEERAVRRARILVGISVAAIGIAVTVAVFFLARARSDQVMFELDYEGFVENIRALVRWEVRYNFALMEQLSASTTISAGLMNATFPFQTNPQFEISGGFVDGMGGIMSAAFAPLITEEQRTEWGVYSRANQGWIEESAFLKKVHPVHRDALHGTIQDHEHDRRLQETTSTANTSDQTLASASLPQTSISRSIYRWENGQKVPEINQPGQLYAPLWQVSPADYGAVNVNLLSDPRIAQPYLAMLRANKGVMSSNFEVEDTFDFLFEPEEKIYKKDPHFYILQPVYDAIIEKEKQKLVGFLVAISPFGNLLDRLLPEGRTGVIAVFKDDCNNTMTFEMSSTKTRFLGHGDFHETKYDQYEHIEYNIEMYEERISGVCTHDLYLYPSTALEESYKAAQPILYTAMVALSFFAVFALFVVYDFVVTRRQNKTIMTALSSQAIVRSLFPDQIGKQMITEAQERADAKKDKSNLQEFESNKPSNGQNVASRKTNAKLYPDATVMFADLVGFTAWSSMREPCHVFALLETIYAAFDKVASQRRVFKVETVGDCYVAVCGLPDPQKQHHVNMARFARDCVAKIGPLLETLGRELGPDTVDLGVRIGLHSGPVTAGVLRGDRARFQLFGDTVNTAARVESTGQKNKVHVSLETAQLLIASGRGAWLTKRKDTVYAKGKGELETFWLLSKTAGSDTHSTSGSTTEASEHTEAPQERRSSKQSNDSGNGDALTVDVKNARLANWNAEILKKLLCEILASRETRGIQADPLSKMKEKEVDLTRSQDGTIVLDELQEIIALPDHGVMDTETEQRFAATLAATSLDDKVQEQLREFVMTIASLYRPNSFHSFEHASHVTMSVRKLLSRITSAEHIVDANNETGLVDGQHGQNAYGITSDPLTQFAIVLSALIHDVDHTGVPNAQLIKENASIAECYRAKSVAEQNSINLSWNLLMQDRYEDLRRAIYCNEKELDRFRKLVVNIVLATDIADKELGSLRKQRWNKAFSAGASGSSHSYERQESALTSKEDVDRKATIVIEHIIQASDIAHTMQHWHVYKKWNFRLFEELYQAYVEGRAEKDPSENWYRGELGFFDFYIIPLAKKLKECGVFGVSSDEYLTYATQNRREWETKGQEVVAEYKSQCEGKYAAQLAAREGAS